MATWWDALVVGAGPAGAVAAHRLARHGMRVALLEAGRLPRHKTCGGGVVGRALRELPVAPERVARSSCSRAELALLDTDLSVSVERERPIVTMTLRAELDASLVVAAGQAGARIHTRSPLRSLRAVDGGVEVGAGSAIHRTRCLVGADGAAGPTRRLAGWRAPLPRIPAIEWEAVARRRPRGAEVRTARFLFGLPGRGYAWVFPRGDHLSVGVLSTMNGGPHLRDQLSRALRAAGVGELRVRRRHGFVIPTRARDEPVARGPVLLAGDAAGLADPVTWEGISHACASGRLAAQALLDAELRPEEAGRRYAAGLEGEVLSELRWARRLAPLLYGPAWRRRLLFRLAGPALCEAMTGIVLGETSYGALLRSPRSWTRLAATRGERARPDCAPRGQPRERGGVRAPRSAGSRIGL